MKLAFGGAVSRPASAGALRRCLVHPIGHQYRHGKRDVRPSAQQAQLMAFFINPPINSTAGALNPVEAMPTWLQPVTVINPIHHFAVIARGGMLKGSGFADLWPNFLGLFLITLVLGSVSVWRFRKQLG